MMNKVQDYRSTALIGASLLAVGCGWKIYRSFCIDLAAAKERLLVLSETKARIFNSSLGSKIQYSFEDEEQQQQQNKSYRYQEPVALILHASGGGFDQGMAYGKALLPKHRLLCISRAGYLQSSADACPRIEHQCSDIVELLDHLGVREVIVVGMSVAGVLALNFASRYPERTVSVILLSPWVPHGNRPPIPDPPLWMLRMFFGSEFVKWAAVRLVGDAMAGVTKETTHDERRMVDAILQTLFPVTERFTGFLQDFTLMKQTMSREDFLKITCPILYVAALDDMQCKPHEHKLPVELKTTEVLEPTGGHLLTAKYSKTQQVIAEFLSSVVKNS